MSRANPAQHLIYVHFVRGTSGRTHHGPVSFEVTADAHAQFMGRFSRPLAVASTDAVGVGGGQTALDVGCGTAALTEVLAARLGADRVAVVDPSESFVASMRGRFPGMDVRQAAAEELPYDDELFDVVLAQLVVHFMTDPVRGLAEMARVARPAGVVGATVWDHAGGAGPLAVFWAAVRKMDPGAHDESRLPGVAEGHLAELFAQAGCPRSSPQRSPCPWITPLSMSGGPRSRPA